MSREELIGRLLDFNKISTFQFTRDWLKKQRTPRLQTLLLAARRQQQEPDSNSL